MEHDFKIITLKRGAEVFKCQIAASFMDNLKDLSFIQSLISTIESLKIAPDSIIKVFPQVMSNGNTEISMWWDAAPSVDNNDNVTDQSEKAEPPSVSGVQNDLCEGFGGLSPLKGASTSGDVQNDLCEGFSGLSPFKGASTSDLPSGKPAGVDNDLDNELNSPCKKKGRRSEELSSDMYEDVIYANVPQGCQPKDLLEQITLQMHLKGLATQSGSPVRNISMVGSYAKIQMRCIQVTRNAVQLAELVVKNDRVCLTKEIPRNAKQAPEMPSKEPPKVVPREATASSSKGPKYSESDEAIESLLHELILRRDVVMGSRIPNSAMSQILNALEAKGIHYNSNFVTLKKRNMVKYYRDKKRMGDCSWRYYDLVAQLVGDMDFDGDFANLKTSNDRLLFDHQATLDLIEAYGPRKDLFDRVQNKHQLWEEVCAEVQAKHPNLKLTCQACERKWLALRSTYFDFRNDANRSGNDGVTMTWVYYDPMNLILQNSLGARPKYTYAVGVKKQVRDKAEMDKSEQEKAGKQVNAGAAAKEPSKKPEPRRLSNVARKLQLEEKKIDTQARFVELMSRHLMRMEQGSNRPSFDVDDEDD